jgi:hypothetical protein
VTAFIAAHGEVSAKRGQRTVGISFAERNLVTEEAILLVMKVILADYNPVVANVRFHDRPHCKWRSLRQAGRQPARIFCETNHLLQTLLQFQSPSCAHAH